MGIIVRSFKKPIDRLDELAREDDSNKVFSKVLELTNRLLVRFNKRYICDRIIEIIDKSKLVRWGDSRNKLTSLKKPVFNIRVDLTDACEKEYPNEYIREYIDKKLNIARIPEEFKAEIVEYKIMIVQREVIAAFTDLLCHEIKRLEVESEEFKALKEDIKKSMKEVDDDKLNRYIIPSIFTILVEKAEANIVKLEYIM